MPEANSSILTWRCEWKDEDPTIVVNYPSTEEMAAITALVEDTLRGVTRDGYDIRCDGSCCKAPQCINWTVTMGFESIESANIIAQAMRLRFGVPECVEVGFNIGHRAKQLPGNWKEQSA